MFKAGTMVQKMYWLGGLVKGKHPSALQKGDCYHTR